MNQDNIEIIKIVDIESLGKLDEVIAEKEVRVLILEFSKLFSLNEKHRFNQTLVKKIKHFPIAIVSKLKIDAKGFLFQIVLASDLCFVSENVSFEIADIEEIRRQIGWANLAKLDSIDKEIDSKTALELGLINGVVNIEDLDEEVLSVAKKIAQLAPIAIKSCLEAVNKGSEMDLKDGLDLEMKLFSRIFLTNDMKEGTSAFLEKREPIFKGE